MQCLVGDKRSKAKQRHVNIFSFCAKKKIPRKNLVKSRWARFKSERFNVKTVQLFTFSRPCQEQHKYFAFSTLVCSKKTKSFVERKSAKIKRSVIFIFLPFAKKKSQSKFTVGYLKQCRYLRHM